MSMVEWPSRDADRGICEFIGIAEMRRSMVKTGKKGGDCSG
jgi:hypothetical protein